MKPRTLLRGMYMYNYTVYGSWPESLGPEITLHMAYYNQCVWQDTTTFSLHVINQVLAFNRSLHWHIKSNINSYLT
jgi:hypothetical protein